MDDKNLSNLSSLKMLYNEISYYQAQDDIQTDLKTTFESQKRVLIQYKQWINMLLSIIKQSNYSEYHDNIRQGIEKIEPLLSENKQLKKMINSQIIQNEQKKKEISNLGDYINNLKLSLKEVSNGILISEKNQLIESINSISDDVNRINIKVDFLSEKNRNYQDFIDKDEVKKLRIELETLKEENLTLKNKIKKKVLNYNEFRGNVEFDDDK